MLPGSLWESGCSEQAGSGLGLQDASVAQPRVNLNFPEILDGL